MKKYAANKYEELTWIQKPSNKRPFPTRQFHRELASLDASIRLSLITTEGWMLVTGNRGKTLVHSVFHNGQIYGRMLEDKGWVIGSKSVYHRFNINCRFLTTARVIDLALQRSEARRITCKATGIKFDVAMLHDWPRSRDILYSCCIYVDGTQIRSLNPEPTGKNRKDVRFGRGVELHDGQLFARLTAIKAAQQAPRAMVSAPLIPARPQPAADLVFIRSSY